MPRDHTVKVGGEWVDGMLVGRAAAISEWRMRKEIDDPEFQRLIWRLQAKKYWASKDLVSKAKIQAYRKQWAKDNREQYRACVNKAKRLWRKQKAPAWLAALKRKREKHAREVTRRLREVVHTCVVCGAQWCYGLGRLPPRSSKYCSQRCRSQANYERGKAAGKSWAMRDKSNRKDRKTR